MGNTSTHRTIAELVMEVLKRETRDRPEVMEDKDAPLFEIGNWLTDISQLRDPFAFISGKLAVWNQKTGISLTNAEQYLDEIMGKPKPGGDQDRTYDYELTENPPPRNDEKNDGILARWLRLASLAFGLDQFVHRQKVVSASEFDSIFKTFYTQYYPHEHLDLPPWPDGPSPHDVVVGNRAGSLIASHHCDAPPMAPKSTATAGGGGAAAANSWIRIRLKDDLGHPLSSVKLVIHRSDGASQDATTDKHGMVEVSGLAASTKITVSCPLIPPYLLENTYTTITREVAGHPIDSTPAQPPDSSQKWVAWVEPVKPAAGSSLKSLASDISISWDLLAQFNFGTAEPRKVNRALRERVGCTQRIDHAGNYRFTGEEKGVIYLPRLWTEEHLGVNRTYTFRAARADGRPVPKAQGRSSAGPAAPGPSAHSSSSSRGVLAYLDEQVEFAADLLTFIECHWKKLASAQAQDQDRKIRHRLLVLLGHACHVVEDYYLHSNFIEITWNLAKRALPHKYRNQAEAQRQARLYYRRLRAPETKDAGLHPEESSDGSTHVSTGLFGATDIFHTLADTLALLAEKYPWLDDPSVLGPVALLEKDAEDPDDTSPQRLAIPEYEAAVVGWDTLGWLANKERRRRLVEKDPVDDIIGRHHKRLKDGTYKRVFQTLVRRKKLCQESADALNKVFDMEKDFVFDAKGNIKDAWEKGVNLPIGILGPFGFLLTLVRQAEEEHNKSEEESLDFDREAVDGKTSLESYKASANGASSENLGFHSLLNKDSKNKEPLYEEAINISARASCFVAETMVSQVVQNAISAARFNQETCGRQDTGTLNTLNRGHYVDWLHLLQHFICHPDECEKTWHIKAVDMPRSVDSYKKNAVGYVLRWIDQKTQKERMKQVRRNGLEKEYHRFEKTAETAWGKH